MMRTKLSPADLIEWGPANLEAAYGRAHYWTEDGGYPTPADWFLALAESVAAELNDFGELPAAARFAFVDDVVAGDAATETLAGMYASDILADFARQMERLSRAAPDAVRLLFKELRATFRERGEIRGRDVMFVVRSALTGSVEGPCLEVVVCLLGRRRALDRVRARLKLIAGDAR